jgi:hypothetical protein
LSLDLINIPLDDERVIETTIGQLNFSRAIETRIIEYIEENYEIETDMNTCNSTSKRKYDNNTVYVNNSGKTRKKREELSISACKCIKKENVNIKISFL